MVRYLQVKKIEAPLEETRFVVDGVHHTLAPELTPVDFGLADGATINVVVPEEYLNPQQEAAEGEEAAGEHESGTAAAVEAL